MQHQETSPTYPTAYSIGSTTQAFDCTQCPTQANPTYPTAYYTSTGLHLMPDGPDSPNTQDAKWADMEARLRLLILVVSPKNSMHGRQSRIIGIAAARTHPSPVSLYPTAWHTKLQRDKSNLPNSILHKPSTAPNANPSELNIPNSLLHVCSTKRQVQPTQQPTTQAFNCTQCPNPSQPNIPNSILHVYLKPPN